VNVESGKIRLRVVVNARARQYNLGNPTEVKYGDDGVDGRKLVLTEVQRRLRKVLNVRRSRARDICYTYVVTKCT